MLYIHIPFCKGKCIYCDFYSSGNPDWEKYLKAVASELSSRLDELRGDNLSSIYIGGGTPSLIPSELFISFIHEITTILTKNNIRLAADLEFTLEVNPDDVDNKKIKTWKDAGINRISIGIQSLDDSVLQFLRRRHSAKSATNALEMISKEFNNISVDIIYGIPNQSFESLDRTLSEIISLKPQHISTYALSYEPLTALTLLRDRNIIQEVNEDLYIQQESIIDRKLRRAGYIRYEISNYSFPGFHSRHNSGYWEGKPYLGLGPSAASYDGHNIRRCNRSDLKAYIQHFEKNATKESFYEEEILEQDDLKIERIFVSLRTVRGINLEDYKATWGEKDFADLLKKAQPWIETGDLKKENNQLSLTRKGILISDFIIKSLI